MADWKKHKLKDLTVKIGSGATPSGGGNAYKMEGISLIRSQNVLDRTSFGRFPAVVSIISKVTPILRVERETNPTKQ